MVSRNLVEETGDIAGCESIGRVWHRSTTNPATGIECRRTNYGRSKLVPTETGRRERPDEPGSGFWAERAGSLGEQGVDIVHVRHGLRPDIAEAERGDGVREGAGLPAETVRSDAFRKNEAAKTSPAPVRSFTGTLKPGSSSFWPPAMILAPSAPWVTTPRRRVPTCSTMSRAQAISSMLTIALSIRPTSSPGRRRLMC